LILALFGVVVDVLDLEPRSGSVMRLSSDHSAVPTIVVLGGWIMETCGLLALYLLAQGRCGGRWLDGLVAGWLAWVFRGPIFVVTIVVATRQPQDPWWRLAFAWWILYSLCGLALAALAPMAEPSEDGHPETEPVEDDEPEGEVPSDDVDDEVREDDDDSTPKRGTDGEDTDPAITIHPFAAAPEPPARELPLDPDDEDPTDRHPTVEVLEEEARAALEGLDLDGDPDLDGGSDDLDGEPADEPAEGER
ncbi:MAG: hypothetical protein AAGE94_12725, partial [Acidobacteriota bacterium]